MLPRRRSRRIRHNTSHHAIAPFSLVTALPPMSYTPTTSRYAHATPVCLSYGWFTPHYRHRATPFKQLILPRKHFHHAILATPPHADNRQHHAVFCAMPPRRRHQFSGTPTSYDRACAPRDVIICYHTPASAPRHVTITPATITTPVGHAAPPCRRYVVYGRIVCHHECSSPEMTTPKMTAEYRHHYVIIAPPPRRHAASHYHAFHDARALLPNMSQTLFAALFN